MKQTVDSGGDNEPLRGCKKRNAQHGGAAAGRLHAGDKGVQVAAGSFGDTFRSQAGGTVAPAASRLGEPGRGHQNQNANRSRRESEIPAGVKDGFQPGRHPGARADVGEGEAEQQDDAEEVEDALDKPGCELRGERDRSRTEISHGRTNSPGRPKNTTAVKPTAVAEIRPPRPTPGRSGKHHYSPPESAADVGKEYKNKSGGSPGRIDPRRTEANRFQLNPEAPSRTAAKAIAATASRETAMRASRRRLRWFRSPLNLFYDMADTKKLRTSNDRSSFILSGVIRNR